MRQLEPLLASRAGRLVLLAVVMASAPLLFPSLFYYKIGATIFITALAAVGLNILMGLAGQVSLGHAGFIGIGAYGVALMPERLGVPAGAALVVAMVISMLIAWIVGRPILRLKGHYLAVVTLGLGMLVALVLTNEAWLTGGPDGMPVGRLTIAGMPVRGLQTWYWISAGVLLIGAMIAMNIEASPTGRALKAVHDSEVAAAINGIDVARYKLAAFVISAAYASLAGSMMALSNGTITPDVAGFLLSIELVTMVVLGGLGSVIGAIVGTALLKALPQVLTSLHDYEHMVLGLIMMLVMILMRQGLVPTLARLIATMAAGKTGAGR